MKINTLFTIPFLVLVMIVLSGHSGEAQSSDSLSSAKGEGAYAQSESEAVMIFESLVKLYDINLIYDVSEIKNANLSQASIGGSTAEKDLKKLLGNSSLEFKKLNDKTFIIKRKKTDVAAQKVKKVVITELQGRVIDEENGDPLIGVSILKKGTTSGTQTDFDGNFSVEIEKDQILVISYIGYETQELVYSDQSSLLITLNKDQKIIDEVVIVGYGTQAKRDLTGAISQISEVSIKQLPNTGLEQALQGRSAGVFVTQNSGAPGGALSIRIRGTASTGTAEPLYVIDGIPIVNDNQGTSATFERDGGGQYTNALTTINPNDIESIEILKDASASAIYGSKAGNGVVLITTKKGKSGKSKLSYDTYVGAQQLYKKIDVMNLQEYAQYIIDANGGNTNIEEFNDLELLGNGTDWQDEVFRTAFMHNHQVSLTGGDEKTTFSISGGYHKKNGIVAGSAFDRFAGKLNLTHNYSDRIRMGGNLSLARTKENITFNDNSNGVIYTALLTPPLVPARTLTGDFGVPDDNVILTFSNPLANALETNDVNRKNRVLASAYVEFDILDGLKYTTDIATDLLASNHNTFWPGFQRANQTRNARVRRNVSNSVFWINKHLLTYDKQIGDQQKITALLGFEAQEGSYEWLYASRDNLPNNELKELNLGDASTQVNGGGAGDWAILSYFGRFNYSLFDKYLITGTYRIDGSSRFGVNNRYGHFPSAALGWRISEENFLRDVDVIDNLKLRVGYGAVGNQEIGLYSFRSLLRSETIAFGNQLTTAYSLDNIANPDVKWESSVQSNLGIDFGLYGNRLEFVLDVYNKVSKDMLLQQIIPSTTGGYSAPFVNIGEMTNRGFEFTINSQNLIKPIEWSTVFTYSMNRNNVVELGTNGAIPGVIQRLPITRTVEGAPIGQYYGFVTDGIFTTLEEISEAPFQEVGTKPGDIRFKDLNGDGMINDQDRTFIGNPNPDWTANLINDFSYRNFDLNIFFRGVFGNEIYNLLKRDLAGTGAWVNQSVDVIDRWTPTNPDGTVPRSNGNDPNRNRRISDRFVEDGSYLRLQNITLGYKLPELAVKRIGISNIRAYVSGQNLFTITNYSGYDPEIGSFNQNPLINGIDNGRFPISRSITVGLNVGF